MSDLVPVPTLDEMLEDWKKYLPPGFPLSNEDAFSSFFTFQKLAAQGVIDVRALIRDLYPQGFVVTANGTWLDLHAGDHNLARIQARHTEGLVDFSVSETVDVPAGSVVQTPTDATGSAYRFIVTRTTTCTPPLTRVPVKAETPGAAWNVGSARITTLVTILDEVTQIRNAAPWITVAGVNRESDDALRRRLQLVWPELGSGATYHAYEAWAREVQGVVKVAVIDNHPRGQGTVDVMIAPGIGLPSDDLIAEVQAIVTERRPITSDTLVKRPATRLVPLTLVLHLKGKDIDGEAVWASRAKGVLEALDIGQTFYPSVLDDALHDFPNVEGVEIISPMSPVAVTPGTLVMPSSTLVTIITS